MTKSEKIRIKTMQIDNAFLRVYINDFVKKFRDYNTDEFVVAIKGLKKFIPIEDTVLVSLIEELKQNNFTIELEGNEESISQKYCLSSGLFCQGFCAASASVLFDRKTARIPPLIIHAERSQGVRQYYIICYMICVL